MTPIENAAVFYRSIGISVIPVNSKKIPSVPKTVNAEYSWKPFERKLFEDKEQHMFAKAAGLAAVGGKISGNLFCIDLDKKYDIENVCDDFLTYALGKHPALVVQKTPSGGYHVIFRADGPVPGNKKIAGRYGTQAEFAAFNEEVLKHNQQVESIKAQGQTPTEGPRKFKEKPEDLKLYPIETRGESGYFLLYPSAGYSIVNGDIKNIPVLPTVDMVDLLEMAASYHNIVEEQRIHVPAANLDDWEITPFDDYNNKCDVGALLQSHGWTFVHSRGAKDFYRRPGSANKQSGNWDHNRKWFTSFTTNGGFQEQKAYKACYVYALLEHNGDFKTAAKALLEQGYGSSKVKTIRPTYKPSELIADYKHLSEYNLKIDKGEIPMGLRLGWPELDMYFRAKQGNFVMINGHPNVGKTEISVYLALATAVRYDWKWVLATTENDAEWIFRSMVEMYAGKTRDKMFPQEILQAEAFIEEHFTILRASEFDFVYQDLIDFGVEYYNKTQKYQGFLIDPYSALSVPDSVTNTHKYNYKAASAFRRMAKELNVAVWLTVHSSTESQNKEDKEGYSIPPKMSETEGGGLFSRRADDFLTVHRVTNHAEKYMVTEIHVRKIKVQQTGGQPTKKGKPFLARYVWPGFVDDISKFNPLTFDYECYQPPSQPIF